MRWDSIGILVDVCARTSTRGRLERNAAKQAVLRGRHVLAAIAPLFLFFAVGAVTPAHADSAAEDPAVALRIARAAFEYRDFERVIAILDPWVHPPRISDRARMVEARELLGVSLHVTGELVRAREEFAQVLLADPEHQLDPFEIPPQVIETFEATRREMSPVLEKAVRERDPPSQVDRAGGSHRIVVVPNRWVAFIPGGVPQFSVGEPALGGVFACVQGLALATNITGFFLADGSLRGSAAFHAGQTMQYAGLAGLIIAYGASVLLGNLSLDAYTAALVSERNTGRVGSEGAPVSDSPGFRLEARVPF